MSSPIFTLANQLTILRMGLAPVLLVLVLSRDHGWALAVFAVAGVTDLLDGLAARLGRQKTTLGAMLDPVADKLLLGSCFVALTWGPALAAPIPVWLSVTVLTRDAIIVVTVVIINLTVGRRVFLPTLLGKLCTVAQLLTVGLVLLLNASGRSHWVAPHLFRLTFVLTVTSALQYVYLASAHRHDVDAP
jgi:cardiolipin synthase